MPATPAQDRAPAVIARPGLLACEECDALYREAPLASGQQMRCVRCGNLLRRGHRLRPSSLLALAIAALVVFMIANLQPVVELNLRGQPNTASLPGGLVDTWQAGEYLVSVLAGMVAFVFPLLVIVLRLYVLSPAATGTLPPAWLAAMHALHFARRWSMVEVLMLAALVSIVRIASMASVKPGPGLVAFGTLAVLLAALETAGDRATWTLADKA